MTTLQSPRSLVLLALVGALAAPAIAQDILPSVTVAPQLAAPDASVATAQPVAPADQQPQASAAPALAPSAPPAFTPTQLEQLVGAIALYPDPLIAQILPATTYPIDIVRANRFIKSGGAPSDIEKQDWDPSVKAIAHNPAVLDLLDSNLEWTAQLGQAFATQPAELMDAVQRRRLQAQDLGNLASNAQQQVYAEDQAIRIFPASPDVVYVPVYDPAVVYYQPAPLYDSYVSYGWSYPSGWWFNLDCDWFHHCCYYPGWCWNSWYSHYNCYAADSYHAHNWCRPSHDFHPHSAGAQSAWRHNGSQPYNFSHRGSLNSAAFDHAPRAAGGANGSGAARAFAPAGGRGNAGSDAGRMGGAGGGGARQSNPNLQAAPRGVSSSPARTSAPSSHSFAPSAAHERAQSLATASDHSSHGVPLSSATRSGADHTYRGLTRAAAPSSMISSGGMQAISARSDYNRSGSAAHSSTASYGASRSYGSYNRGYPRSSGSYGSSSYARSYAPASQAGSFYHSGTPSHSAARAMSAPATHTGGAAMSAGRGGGPAMSGARSGGGHR